MSDEDLKKLREKRLAQLKEQAARAQSDDQVQEMQQQQQAQYQAQIQAIISQILTSDARARLTNIRISRPEFAQMLESQLVSLYQRGVLGKHSQLNDEQFKQLLIKIQKQTKKREGKIQFR